MFRYVLPFIGLTFIQAFTNYHAISFCIVSNQKNFLSDYSHGFVIVATTVYCRLHMYYVLLLNTFLLIRFATNVSGFIALAMCVGEDEGTLTVRRRSTPWMFCAKTHCLWGYNGVRQRDSSMNKAFVWCWLCYRLQEIMTCEKYYRLRMPRCMRSSLVKGRCRHRLRWKCYSAYCTLWRDALLYIVGERFSVAGRRENSIVLC